MAHNKVHHGKNLRKFREWKDMKQETLAFELGDDWSQKKISLLEQKEKIDDDILKQLAAVLKVPVEAFDALNEDPSINIINSTFNDQAIGGFVETNNINPIEKWMEALDENKKLIEENKALYERLLKEKDEMIARLEALVKK